MGEIRVATFNCWGLKYVSKDRHERIAAIANAFSRSDYDIIALQEIWVEADYNQIRDKVCQRLPYTKLFHSGALGAGLAVFTKWPIIATDITPYSLNGEPMDVTGGDWYVGKAAGSVTVFHPTLGEVQIFVTHFHAKGGDDGPEYNRAHRLVNAWEFAKVTRQAAELGLGDFNSIPSSLVMNIIRSYAGLSDSWTVSHPYIPPPTGMITPLDGVEKYGVTADSPLNSYRDSGPSGSVVVRTFQGKRLDYILFRQPSCISDNPDAFKLTCRDSRVIFTDSIPGSTCSYSDHFGVEATLIIIAPNAQEDVISGNTAPKVAEAPWADTPSEMTSGTISEVLGALQTSYRISQGRSRRELTVFALGILLLLGLIIGSAWVPLSWVNPIFVLFTIFIAWLTTTMLYEGFIFGNWERRALRSVLEELDFHKRKLTLDRS
ncbi:Endonuclease/exonuclease/phosphatase [Boletus reticuloceps]|uniref:Endonuclease/exonuclease/phosphatase n=1 Tax=Boletus reticuloceps TaxID=495285 RepID=A0A8I3AFX4_9AGAM|nr:Endonuclease/exonuclease/phosphatase [Boletus reticuloceps]